MAEYNICNSIELDNLKLIRQDRVDLDQTFSCLSWREIRKSSGTNRRFYFEKGVYWHIPISIALDMMKEAKIKGLFKHTGNSLGEITEISIIQPKDKYYDKLITSVLVNSPYDAMWHNCIAVLCMQNDRLWRKVMMLSPSTKKATFRSLSIDSNYKNYRNEITGDGWKLDAAMLDAHTTAFSHFLNYLESFPKIG